VWATLPDTTTEDAPWLVDTCAVGLTGRHHGRLISAADEAAEAAADEAAESAAEAAAEASGEAAGQPSGEAAGQPSFEAAGEAAGRHPVGRACRRSAVRAG
jgi:hypothetical protein